MNAPVAPNSIVKNSTSRKAKVIILLELFIILALLVIFVTRFISFSDVKPIVRSPEQPNASTLSYVPPPPPKVSVSTLQAIKNIREQFSPEVSEVADGVYLARGFGVGSVMMVETDEGLVIIDTSEAQEVAQEILAEFRKITNQPIKKIIYTHSHIDHIFGSPIFFEEAFEDGREAGMESSIETNTEVIATKRSVEQLEQDLGWYRDFHDRSREIQTGRSASEFSKKLPLKSPFKHDKKQEYITPTITFEKEYKFELGGKKFELYHAIGETPGHLMVWMPEQKVLFTGDLYYESFPNLSTPMFESRPVKEWYESLERMILLQPDYLIPSHTKPLIGATKIQEVLSNHSHAIKYVYEETIKAINAGKSVDDAVASIQLPEELAKRTHLKEAYGRVDWAVRGIYRQMTGWYDGKGTGLNPLPPKHRATEIVKLSGGANGVLKRAIELQEAGEHQLVAELCDVVIQANPEDKLARTIKAYSLDYLGIQGGNLNMFGFYRSAAAMEREAAGIKP